MESLHIGVVAGGEVPVYRFRVQYEYTVDGNSYVSDRITFDDVEDSRKNAESLASKYPYGKSISLSYNPNNPDESVLEPRELPPDWTHWLFFFVLFAALGDSARFLAAEGCNEENES